MQFIVSLPRAMRSGVTANIFCILASAATAGGHDCQIAEVTGVADATSNAQCLMAKIQALDEANKELRKVLADFKLTPGPQGSQGAAGRPGTDAQFPRGAVLAFDMPNGCPFGWTDMGAKWRGKTLIVAVSDANDKYGFGREGGAETHTLTTAQLPSHSHGFTGQSVTRGGWGGQGTRIFAVGGSQAVSNYRLTGEIAATGGGRAHNNMPPFVALYFCKKE